MKVVVTARIIVACAALVGLSGCETFQGAHTAQRFPPPGKLVEIDGRKLQIDCRGNGSPTVVLESGGMDIFGGQSWAPIQDSIAATTRVCSYSRPGFMWSDSLATALDDEGYARDLRAALRTANEAPPFVLVSHSRGALYSLIFADMFRAEVAGLVFAEPRPPALEARRALAGIKQTESQPLGSVKILRALRWTGLPHTFAGGYCSAAALPAPTIEACKAYFPHSLDGIISENTALAAVTTRAAKVHDLGSRPVLVLTRQATDEWYSSLNAAARVEQQKSDKLWSELHAEMATLSSRGERRFVLHASHDILSTHPQVVADAVKEVVELVRRSGAGTR